MDEPEFGGTLGESYEISWGRLICFWKALDELRRMRGFNGQTRFLQTPSYAFEVCCPVGSLWFEFKEVWPGFGGVNGIYKCCKGHHWIASETCLAMVWYAG